jgi:two-component system sensor histidine kinase BaeS
MTLVRKTFLVFVTAFLVQLAVVALLLGIGYRQSEHQWRSVREQQAHETARSILTGTSATPGMSEYSGQLAVYDTQGTLVVTSRGMGMRGQMSRNIPAAVLNPVSDAGSVIGYYATGSQVFGDDTANQALLQSMTWVLLASLVFSLGVSLVAAIYFSRRVSGPADGIARALQAMTAGNISDQVTVQGSDELVRIAESIESLRLRLIRERTVRSQWSQDLAHDLRTPVASRKAQIEGMGAGILAPTKERFERTGRELARMEALIDDLEMLMRLESPEARLSPQMIEARPFALETTQRFEAQIKRKGIRIAQDIRIRTFEGDSLLLSRAVSNLLSNAIRHVDEHGCITVSIKNEKGTVVISVHNTGTPIPPEELPKLFERLYRGEYARNSAGSGLGLTIVDRIARLHGGSASITSSPGEGTEARISFPILTV